MEPNKAASVREVFEQMSTEQLDEILNNELGKEPVDDNAIRLIMSILRERDKDKPIEITPEIQQAWEKYQRSSENIWEESRRERRLRSWIIRVGATAAALVLLLLPIVPTQAGAESVWQKMAGWSEDIFEFFNPNAEERPQEEYAFHTEIEGLQQVYDAVVELGVTIPVVPSWLPDNSELIACKRMLTPALNTVSATFTNENREIVFNVNTYTSYMPNKYPKDQELVKTYEKNGVTHSIMQNNDMWVVVWSIDNVECSIIIDCQEDTLYHVLASIYGMEDD